MAEKPRKSNIYYAELDGLRTVAIAMVLIAHLCEFSLNSSPEFFKLGGLGVHLFFILSGFLITDLLIVEELSFGRIDLFKFYARRVLRVFPAFYFFLAIISVLIAVDLVTDISWYSLIVTALFLRNLFGNGSTLGHMWTLSLEEQFYAIWPAVLKWVTVRHRLAIVCLATVLIIMFRMIMIVWLPEPYYLGVYYIRPYYRFDAVLFGCAIAIVLNRSLPIVNTRRQSIYFVLRSLRHVAFPALLIWSMWAETLPGGKVYYLTGQGLLGAAFVFQLLTTDSWLRKLLSSQLLRWPAKYSYSLYLWQQLFLVTHEPSWGYLRSPFFNLLAAIAVAVFSYHVIERPFLAMRRQFRPEKLNKSTENS